MNYITYQFRVSQNVYSVCVTLDDSSGRIEMGTCHKDNFSSSLANADLYAHSNHSIFSEFSYKLDIASLCWLRKL